MQIKLQIVTIDSNPKARFRYIRHQNTTPSATLTTPFHYLDSPLHPNASMFNAWTLKGMAIGHSKNVEKKNWN